MKDFRRLRLKKNQTAVSFTQYTKILKLRSGKMRIAILGGGLTGIVAGYLLNKKGLESEVLEKE